jgi:hypothetical protein
MLASAVPFGATSRTEVKVGLVWQPHIKGGSTHSKLKCAICVPECDRLSHVRLSGCLMLWHLVFNDAVGKTVRSYLITDQSASAAVVASESCISSQQCLTCILELRMEGDVYEVNEPQ